MIDRKRGMFLGLAIGDALGAAVEFKRPGTFQPVTGYRAGGPHRLAAGEWTDDTSMALALADSIVQKGWDLNDQAERYLKWWRSGVYSVNGRCFDIGVTISQSLSNYERNRDAANSGLADEFSSGNGSIMRLAPVPIAFAGYFPDRIEELARLASESSRPTHRSEQCLSVCACLGVMLTGLLHGHSRDEVLDPSWPAWRTLDQLQWMHPRVREVVMTRSYLRKNPPLICGSGYVIDSLEASLWAFAGATCFEEAVLKAVNLGEDADTTGAVCGQLAGACWGESGIPESLKTGLAGQHLVAEILEKLVHLEGLAAPGTGD